VAIPRDSFAGGGNERTRQELLHSVLHRIFAVFLKTLIQFSQKRRQSNPTDGIPFAFRDGTRDDMRRDEG
jgi:hypothetical protein